MTEFRRKKWVIAGGRDFSDKELFRNAVWPLLENGDIIIEGGARGADAMAKDFAEYKAEWFHHQQMPADWDKHKKAAGAIRNQQMAQAGDALIAFWDGKSKGTKDMIEKMTRQGKDVHIIRYNS